MRVTHDTLAAYCGHPNVGAVLVIALGCEQVVAQTLAEAAQAPRQAGGDRRDSVRGRNRAHDREGRSPSRGEFADALAAQPREWCDASELVLSLKCGGSDYTSGLASNPTLGRVTDRLVDLGGTAVLGEIAEIMGAEHLLASRATRPRDGDRADPDHHAGRDRSARARARHPRHAAVARQHPRRADDDRREIARRDAQRRRASRRSRTSSATRRRSRARA